MRLKRLFQMMVLGTLCIYLVNHIYAFDSDDDSMTEQDELTAEDVLSGIEYQSFQQLSAHDINRMDLDTLQRTYSHLGSLITRIEARMKEHGLDGYSPDDVVRTVFIKVNGIRRNLIMRRDVIMNKIMVGN